MFNKSQDDFKLNKKTKPLHKKIFVIVEKVKKKNYNVVLFYLDLSV